MKVNCSFKTTHRTSRDFLLRFWLWILAVHLPFPVFGQANYATPYTFTTLAGVAPFGGVDGTGSAARFAYPNGLAVDSAGNVYVADSTNNTIRKVTPAGSVTTLAGLAGSSGTNDGTGSAARFYAPRAVAVHISGNVFVADTGNGTVRKVTPMGVVTTLASGFNAPNGVAVDTTGNVYVADLDDNTVWKVTPTGVVTTLASGFNWPSSMAVDTAGNLYVADTDNGAIRKVTPTGVVTTLASGFNYPTGVAVDSASNVYVADTYNCLIRQVTPTGVVTTLAGVEGTLGSTDETNSAALFWYPYDVAVDASGNLYVADTFNSTIRKMTPSGTNWIVTTFAGLAGGHPALSGNPSIAEDGTGSAARFDGPSCVAADNMGNVFLTDSGSTVRMVTPGGVVTTLAGLTNSFGTNDGVGNMARFNYPSGVAVDGAGSLYVDDSFNYTIRKVTPVGTNWVVTTLAGLAGSPGSADGTNSAAQFYESFGLTLDGAGNIYVADTYNNTIRKVTPMGTNWVVTTLAGLAGSTGTNDGTGSAALFNQPYRLAVDSVSNVYVADFLNCTIRKVTPVGTNWVVTTMAGSAGSSGSADGTGSAARFNYPTDVAVDNIGNVYVADALNQAIRKVTPAGVVTTLAGLAGSSGSADGTGINARFYNTYGVTVDNTGNVYVADGGNHTIRKGFIANSAPAPSLLPPNQNLCQFGFGITGLSGLPVNVESSGDFSHWQVIGTYILNGGSNYFVSPNPSLGARFYRGHVR